MKTTIRISLIMIVVALLGGSAVAQNVQQEREAKIAADVKKMATDDYWIYNDLAAAKKAAADTQKPLMIVFR